MIFRTEYKGHDIVFWSIISSKSLWLASYGYLLVDGKIVAKSGGFCLSDSAKGEFLHNGSTISIEMRTKSASGGVNYELLIDSKIFNYGSLKSSVMKKEPADIERSVVSELESYHIQQAKKVELIDEKTGHLSEPLEKYKNTSWYIFLKKYGIALMVLFTCFAIYNEQPDKSSKEKLNQKYFDRLIEDNRALIEEYSGTKVLVSFYNFYQKPFRRSFTKALKSNGVLVHTDDRDRVEDTDPLHPSNIKYCLNKGILFSFSGVSERRAKFNVASKTESFFFRYTEISYELTVNNIKAESSKKLNLKSYQKKRFQPYIIYLSAILLWGTLTIRRRYYHLAEDKSLDYITPIIFCYLASTINEAGVGDLGITSIALLFCTIFILCIKLKPGMSFFLWLSFLFAFYYLIIKLLLFQWDAALTILILIGMASPFVVRIFIHIPYLRSIIIKMKGIEQFYLERFDLIQENKLITYLPNKSWFEGGTKLNSIIQADISLYIGWVLAQIPIAIAIQIGREFLDPSVYYLMRSSHGNAIIAVTLVKGIFAGFFGVLPSLIAITFFCVRPITLFRVSNLSPDGRHKAALDITHKKYLKIAPKYVSIISILLGSLLTVSYFLPWINLQTLSAYFEIPIWQYLQPGDYSGLKLAQSMSDHKWFHYLWPCFTMSLFLYGIILPLKHFKIELNRKRNAHFCIFPFSIPYYLFVASKECVHVVANISYVVIPTVVLVCIFFIPIYVGFPAFFKSGIIITVLSLLLLQLTLYTMETNKIRKFVNNSFSTILLLVFLIGAYKFVLIQNRVFDDIHSKGIKFSGFEHAVSYFLTNTIFKEKIKPNHSTSEDFVVVPAGNFMDGDIGNILYSHFDSSKKLNGGWKYLDQFKINKYEVTISQYQIFLNSVNNNQFDHPSQPSIKKDHLPAFWHNKGHVPVEWYEAGIVETANLPVVGVDWWDACAYCKWAGGQLPSIDQWEKAYRGVNGKYWPWGNSDLKEPQANTSVGDLDDGYEFAAPIGTFKNDRSTFEVFDMAGNVAEWCQIEGQVVAKKQPVKGFHFEEERMTGTTPALYTKYEKTVIKSSHIGFRCVKE